MVQLELLNAPKASYIHEAIGQGVVNEDSYDSASAEKLAKIDAYVAQDVPQDIDLTLKPMFVLAQTLSKEDPFHARVNWMFEPSSPVYYDADGSDDNKELYAACGGSSWGSVITKRDPTFAQSYKDTTGDQCRAGQPCPMKFLMPVGYHVKQVVTDTQGKAQADRKTYCIFPVTGDEGKTIVYLSTYDRLSRVFHSLDEAYQAHENGMANMLLRVGYGPFRVFLDTWWNILKQNGLRTGDRPYLKLDKDLDDYVATGSEGPLTSMVNSISLLVDHPELLIPERRSKFVGYGLQYGPGGLLSLDMAVGYDYMSTGEAYPLETLERFLARKNRAPEDMRPFFSGQAAAKFIAIR